MIDRTLKTVLNRVVTWPKGAQQEALKALQEIEEDFIIGPATKHELDQAHLQALRGEGIFLEELKERLDM